MYNKMMKVEIVYHQEADEFHVSVEENTLDGSQKQTEFKIPQAYFQNVDKIGSLAPESSTISGLLYLLLKLPMAMVVASSQPHQLPPLAEAEHKSSHCWYLSQIIYELIKEQIFKEEWQKLAPNYRIQSLFKFIQDHNITCMYGQGKM